MRAKFYLVSLLVFGMGSFCFGQEAEQVFEEINYETPAVEFVDAELRPELFIFDGYEFSKSPVCAIQIQVNNIYHIIYRIKNNEDSSWTIKQIIETTTAKKLSKEQLVFIDEAYTSRRKISRRHYHEFGDVLPITITSNNDYKTCTVYGMSEKDAKIMAEALLEFLSEQAEQNYNDVVKIRKDILEKIADLVGKKEENSKKLKESKENLKGLDVHYTSAEEATEIIIGLNKQINDLDIEAVGLRTKSEMTERQLGVLTKKQQQYEVNSLNTLSIIEVLESKSKEQQIEDKVKKEIQELPGYRHNYGKLKRLIESHSKIIDKLEEQQIELNIELAVLDSKMERTNDIRLDAINYIRIGEEIERLKSSGKSFHKQLNNKRNGLITVEKHLSEPKPEMRVPEVVDGKGYVYSIQ